ncbi:MAG: type II secretion system protein GspJ [Sedimentisphaerales bacterium]|jgi:type II secretion system protein J
MSESSDKNGFTLVELLIALALIATILSMVYGSYFATSRSAQACEAGMDMCRQGQAVLDQMARQIRGAYAGTRPADVNSGPSDVRKEETVRQAAMSYFTGASDAPKGEILRLVTTNGSREQKNKPVKGLFKVAYRFDKGSGTLLVTQSRFTAAAKKTGPERWKTAAKGVEYLNLEFFDGRQWRRRWESSKERRLPSAVRMDIGLRNEDGRLYDGGTVAYLSCRRDPVETTTER